MLHKVVSFYAPISKWLHWAIALIVMPLLALSFFLEDVPQIYKGTVFMVHKSLGLTVLLLMVIRFFLIIGFGKPLLPRSIPRWERILSHVVQYSFYVFLILMPLSGWVMSTAANRAPVYFNLISLPFPGILPNKELVDFLFSCHQIIAWILITLLVFHVAGALKHYFIDKDDVLQRML